MNQYRMDLDTQGAFASGIMLLRSSASIHIYQSLHFVHISNLSNGKISQQNTTCCLFPSGHIYQETL